MLSSISDIKLENKVDNEDCITLLLPKCLLSYKTLILYLLHCRSYLEKIAGCLMLVFYDILCFLYCAKTQREAEIAVDRNNSNYV